MSANWQTLEVRLDAGVSADQQYIWGLRYIDDLVVRDRTVTDPLDERIYAMQEVQWNVIALADTSGDVVERFAYHPYGKSQTLTSTFTSSSDSYHWQYRFTSREHDLDTGLDYFRNRYWHSMVGVFITRDPLEYVDGASLYAGYFVPGGMDASGELICEPEKEDKCTIRVCIKPATWTTNLAGQGHMYITLNDEFGFRAGPNKDGKLEAEWNDFTKEKFLDHPDKFVLGKAERLCDTYEVKDCKAIKKCLLDFITALNKDKPKYNAVPGLTKTDTDANSNSFVAWALQKCIKGRIISGKNNNGKDIMINKDFSPGIPAGVIKGINYGAPGFNVPFPDIYNKVK